MWSLNESLSSNRIHRSFIWSVRASGLDQQQRSVFLNYAVADQTELFRLSLVLDQTFGLILKIRPNSGLIFKIRPKACHHLKNLCKLGLRLKFGLRTNSDLFIRSPTVGNAIEITFGENELYVLQLKTHCGPHVASTFSPRWNCIAFSLVTTRTEFIPGTSDISCTESCVDKELLYLEVG